MFGARGKVSAKQKKIRWIITVCVVVLSLLIELLGRVLGWSFNGWSDVFAWFGMPQAKVIHTDELQVHFINVGNADCILVRQGDHAMLIDAGEVQHGDMLLDYLHRHDVDQLDLVIATHPHSDHMGSLSTITAHIPVRRFVMSYEPDDEAYDGWMYTTIIDHLDEDGAQIDQAKAGTVYELGAARVQILSPSAQEYELDDENEMSIVARLTFGEYSFLFTGDAIAEAEARMLEDGYALKSDVLKVAHHGSKTSTSPAFLKAVSPQYAVFSCGDNDYGHPNGEVMERVYEIGAEVYRTDMDGNIIFISDGNTLSVRTDGV